MFSHRCCIGLFMGGLAYRLSEWPFLTEGDITSCMPNIVLLEGLPPVRVRNGWLRMATTLISQRQLADGELADGDDEDRLFVVEVGDDDMMFPYTGPRILLY